MKEIKDRTKDLLTKERHPVIYLATPYTHPLKSKEQERFEKVTIVSGLLAKLGYVNISPITQSHEQGALIALPGDWEFWQHIDGELMHRSDELWILTIDGWKISIGVTAEIELAKEQNMPVKYVHYNEKTGELFHIPEQQAREVLYG